ncbi:DNA primase DnaG [Candidatus Hadarchaeum sp.]|uniref:DNA primase DnaG n=2 Tax=Candidatus Hadarchaeum sp. TaxID=2883567 RepID=UPI003857D551
MPVEEKSLQDLVAEKLGKKEVSNMREDSGTTKYLIHAKIEASGVVERPDVVGAIFGQTEGLLGSDLDLRELLKSGRIGRIKVEINSSQGKSTGTITIPSSLDRVETAIIAASLETIDRVGPCEATIKVERIEDVRDIKRKFVVERAKELLGAFEEAATETQEITEKVMESVRVEEISEYEGLPAGPGVKDSDAIIIVEGRADVLNLLRAGIKNAIGIEGTSVPKAVIDLTKDKTVTAFVDSDRGGDLILKELLQVAEIDFVARPPPGRSVEELSKKEIIKALRNKVPVEIAAAEYRAKPAPVQPAETGNGELQELENMANKLRGTLKAQLLNEKLELMEEIQVRELKEHLSQAQNVKAVVFDGVITQELAELAAGRGVQYLVGMRSRVESVPPNLRVLTLDDLRRIKHQR